jgi:hypothetical protein
VLACGDDDPVHELIEWLWTGSSASKVTAVAVSDFPVEPGAQPTSFLTR